MTLFDLLLPVWMLLTSRFTQAGDDQMGRS